MLSQLDYFTIDTATMTAIHFTLKPEPVTAIYSDLDLDIDSHRPEVDTHTRTQVHTDSCATELASESEHDYADSALQAISSTAPMESRLAADADKKLDV